MHLYQKAKEYFRNELGKLKPLSCKDRLWYIWEYHKFRIVVAVFVVSVLTSVLCNIFSPAEIYLSNATVNLTSLKTSEYDSLSTDVHSILGLDKHEVITISPFYLSFDTSYDMEHTMALQSLLVRIATNDLDLIFLPESDFYAMESVDIYTNIKQLLPDTLWREVESCAIYVSDSETGIEYPAALNVTAVPAIQKNEFITDSVVVCISPTAQHLENCSAMIAYLFGEDDTE